MTPVSRSYDLSGFGVRVAGLDAECAEVLDEVWGAFAGAGGETVLVVEAAFAGARLARRRVDDAPLEREVAADAARFRSAEGEIAIRDDGRASARVGSGGASARAFALLNLLLPALAWRLPAFGAAVVHSGGILVGERGFLLVGAAGAGKSTFVAQAVAGGARAVSEDLNVVASAGERLVLAASPLRTRIHRGPGPGRWPLAALLHPRHGETPALGPVDALLAGARLQANLPFVGDCWMRLRGARELSARFDAWPARELTFAPRPDFVPLLERWRAD